MDLRTLTRCSFLCALGVALMYAATIFPVLSLTIVAAAGIMPAVARVHGGTSAGVSVFFVTSLLALLLVPEKDLALLYLLFFGCYPLMKYYIDKQPSGGVRWIFKLAYFNTVFYALWFLTRALVFGQVPQFPGFIFALQGFMNFFFVVFDAAAGKIIYQIAGVFKHTE